MKGVVFTEFLDMVDEKFGMDTTEKIISSSDLPSGGAYTAVGTYDHAEIVSLVGSLSAATGAEVPALVHTFGCHLMGRFAELCPDFFEAGDVTEFLDNVDGYIHGEVRKLYPDAALPKIETERQADGRFVVVYRSKRMMGDLAEGLIAGAIAHFGDTHAYEREDMPNEGGAQCVRFTLRPKA